MKTTYRATPTHGIRRQILISSDSNM